MLIVLRPASVTGTYSNNIKSLTLKASLFFLGWKLGPFLSPAISLADRVVLETLVKPSESVMFTLRSTLEPLSIHKN